MKKWIEGVMSAAFLVVLFAGGYTVLWSSVVADSQEKPSMSPSVAMGTPIQVPPTVSKEKQQEFTIALQSAQMAAKEASPEALAAAITQLIAQRQQAAQQAAEQAQAVWTSLQVEGYTLDAKTWTYTRKPK